MPAYLIKLCFDGPVGTGVPLISSDTIFGGLISYYSYLFGAGRTVELLESFNEGSLPFRLTSAFPYFDNILFVLRPVDMDVAAVVPVDIKTAKKTRFIPLELLMGNRQEKTLSPEKTLPTQEKDKKKKEFSQRRYDPGNLISWDNGFLGPADIAGPVYYPEERARVTLDAITSASHVYYVTACSFSPRAGLWFYLEVAKDDIADEILASLRLLGEEGIGGERSYGWGSFKPVITKVENLFANGDVAGKSESCGKYVLLSLYHPTPAELVNIAMPENAFQIVERGGFVAVSGYARKRVRMLAEGSAFNFEPQGDLVDVTPEGIRTRIFHYGIAFSVRVNYPVRGMEI